MNHSTEPDAKILIDHLDRMKYICPFCPDVVCRDKERVIVHMYKAHRSLPDFTKAPIPFGAFARESGKKDGPLAILKKEYSFGSDGKVIFKDKYGQV